MVDASSFFIVFEFLREYALEVESFFLDIYSLFIWGGVALLMIALWFLLQQSRGKTAKVFFVIATIAAITSIIFFLMSFFSIYHSTVEEWAKSTFGLDVKEFYTFSFLLLLGTTCVTAIVLSFFQPKRPDNDSTLNTRQKMQAYAAFSGIAASGLALWYWVGGAFSVLLIFLIVLGEIVSILFWLYDPIIYVISKLLKRKSKAALEPTPGKINRFAILACARNEEKVIGHLVDSLFATTYPRSKYDVFVLCDNCDDRTAEVAKERGAIAMERFDPLNKGKGEALKWMFGILEDMRSADDAYDAYIVLDADNLVNSQYLSEVNAHLNQGHEIMQTNIGSKNPDDTWVSKCYSMTYWLRNASYQEARSSLNLSAQMGGTGMVLRPTVIEELDWESDSLTEDFAMTAKYLLKKDKPCHWVHTARLYAENPLSLRPSLKQRTRWMQGHMDAMMRYSPNLLVSSVRNLSLKQLDMALYLVRPFANLSMLILYLARTVLLFAFPGDIASLVFIMDFQAAAILFLGLALFNVYILNSERYLRYAPWLPLQYIFTYTWYVPIIRGLIKYRERYWVSTIHGRDLMIGDVHEDVLMREARQRLAGLDNLHMLPIGQILLKAAIITGDQLNQALSVQKKTGGFLGNILVETGALSEETLDTYVNIQQVIRKATENDSAQLQKLQLGQILLDANIITVSQLARSLDYQRENGGRFGESLVELRIIPDDILNIFLEVQDLIGANYINSDKAHNLVKSIAQPEAPSLKLEAILLAGGLISQRQLEAAQSHQAEHGNRLVDALIELGYITPEAVHTIVNAVSTQPKQPVSEGGA